MENPNLSFLEAHKQDARVMLLQGGTRSGKTYSALQFIIRTCYAFKDAGLVISICRKTMPALRATAMRDFITLVQEAGVYSEADHHKAESHYSLFGNTVEFVNLDDEQKVRGRKRHMLYVNEANEISHETVRQLLFRTSGLAIFDYNPSILESHWLISDLLQRTDAKRIITTYKDNPHLSASQVEEIERLQKVDPELWKVFGLGEIGAGMRGLVYPNWQYGWAQDGQRAFGLDFGYSPDPLALIECTIQGQALYVREHLYRNNLTPSDIVSLVGQIVPRGVPIFCDHRPEIIEELRRKSLNAIPATKDIDAGVRTVKQYAMFVHSESMAVANELKTYKYREDKDGNPIAGAYVDWNNHAMDAIRYAVMGMAKQSENRLAPKFGGPRLRFESR